MACVQRGMAVSEGCGTALEDKGIPILPASMMERAAFSAMFQIGGTIFDLSDEDVSNPRAALANAQQLATAVIETLRAQETAAA